MDKLIYLVYPVLLICLFAGSKVCLKRGEWNEDFLSLKQTKMIQGFLALVILCHHLSQKLSAYWMDERFYRPGMEFFVDLGYLCVSVFFFYSGFGLLKSYMNKENYLKGYFKRRVLLVVIAFYTSEIFYLIARLARGEKMNLKKFLIYLIGIKQTSSYAWYAIIIILFYILFYIVCKLLKTPGKVTAAMWILTLVYIICGTYINHNDYFFRGEWWYNSVILFPIGMSFAMCEEKICKVFKKIYPLLLPLCFILAVVMFFVALKSTFDFSYYYNESPIKIIAKYPTVWRRWVCVSAQSLAAVMFTLVILIFSMKVKIGNKVLDFMGGITLEFYLIQGLFVCLFCFIFEDDLPSLYFIENPTLYCIVVLVLSLIGALICKKINQVIMGIFKEK